MDGARSPSYRQIAYDFLVDQIVSQTYKVGDHLNERHIAEQLGISRTPVREAIQLLELEGWVTVIARAGTVVCGLSFKRVEEVFQIRLCLEKLSAQLLAERITDNVAGHLFELIERQKAAAHRDIAQFIRLDREFHNYIAASCGNALLQDILTKINSPLMRMALHSVGDSKRYGWSIREHTAIAEALVEGRSRDAGRAMQHHIEKTYLGLQKQLARTTAKPQ